MPEATVNPMEILIENGIAKPYGKMANRHLAMADIVAVMTAHDLLREDVVVPRGQIQARAVDGTFAVNVGDKGYIPTSVAVRQISEKTKIPTAFLLDNIRKYPALAADMVNAWLRDDEVVNMVGTSRERKTRVTAESQRQLARLFRSPNGGFGTLRAVLSGKYMIVNNTDMLAEAITIIEKRKLKVDASGSLTDDRMYVRFKCKDISHEVQFKNKGVGHEMIRVPCGASLLMQGSDVGLGTVVLAPEIEFFTCTNLARSSEALSQIHIGKEYEDMGLLSDSTIKKMNAALFGRMRDIISSTLSIESFKQLADRMFVYAGERVEKVQTVIENVTEKFGLDRDSTKSVLDRFINEGHSCRFGLSQALTAEAHKYREEDFEKSLAFEEAGSKILTLAPGQFNAFTKEVSKN